MKTVIAGFSHSNNIFSKLIMWMTNSNISHAYVRIDDIVFQASGLYVNEEAYEYFLTFETVVKEIPVQLTDEQFEQSEILRKQSFGKPYSISEVIGFIWIIFVKKVFNKDVANPFRDGNKAYVCCKLVADYCHIDDVKENMTPVDLFNILNKDKS